MIGLFIPCIAAIALLIASVWYQCTSDDVTTRGANKKHLALCFLGLAIFNWVGFQHSLSDYAHKSRHKEIIDRLDKTDNYILEMRDSYNSLTKESKGDHSGAKKDSNKVVKTKSLRQEDSGGK